MVLNTNSPPFVVDETIFYAGKVRQVLDGNWKLGDPMILEYKNSASPHLGEWLPAVIMAGFSKISGGIPQGFMLADFFWPAADYFSILFGFSNFLLAKKLASGRIFYRLTGLLSLFLFQFCLSFLRPKFN